MKKFNYSNCNTCDNRDCRKNDIINVENGIMMKEYKISFLELATRKSFNEVADLLNAAHLIFVPTPNSKGFTLISAK